MKTMNLVMIIVKRLSGMIVNKNARLKKQKKRRVNDHFLASIKMVVSIHQDGVTSVFLRMRKKRQKNCGHKYGLLLCLVTGYKKSFDQKELQIKDVFYYAIYL